MNEFFSLNPFVKVLVIVDEDVDPEDPEEVDWAIITRVRPDEDIIMKPNVPGMPIDPSIRDDGMITKVGIDATKPLQDKERFEKVDIPKDIKEKIRRLMKKEDLD